MQDIFDLNPDMTVEEAKEWADNEDNAHLETYLRECIRNHDQ